MSEEKRSRGGCLIAFLIVMMIFSAIGLIGQFMPSNLKSQNTTDLIITVALSAAMLAGLIGTWYFKAWGVYLYTLGNITSVIVSFMVDKTAALDASGVTPETLDTIAKYTKIGTVVFTVIFLGIFLYLTRFIWKNSENKAK